MKYGIFSVKLNLLSTIPFLLGLWNEPQRDNFRGKLVENPRCRHFPFGLPPDFHSLNITWSNDSGISKESSAAAEENSPESSPRCPLQSYQAIDLNVSAKCLICTFQTDLVIFFFHFYLHAWSALEYWNNLESYLVCNSSINLSAQTCSPAGN